MWGKGAGGQGSGLLGPCRDCAAVAVWAMTGAAPAGGEAGREMRVSGAAGLGRGCGEQGRAEGLLCPSQECPVEEGNVAGWPLRSGAWSLREVGGGSVRVEKQRARPGRAGGDRGGARGSCYTPLGT